MRATQVVTHPAAQRSLAIGVWLKSNEGKCDRRVRESDQIVTNDGTND